MSIPFCDLKSQYKAYQSEIDSALQTVIENTSFINGPQVKALEEDLAKFCGSQHVIGCGNGTDALVLALKALGVGTDDEVIVPAFSFFASAEAVSLVGAVPVFAQVLESDFNLDPADFERKITPKTKAVIPVSLYGQCPDMRSINAIADKHGVSVLEDGAQSFGATYHGERSCNLSKIATTSFFPSKPLGGYGDGGAVFTSDEGLADQLRMLRSHGWKRRYYSEIIGTNSRLDSIQAAVVGVKLKHFPAELEKRESIAQRYREGLQDVTGIQLPKVQPNRSSAWAQFTLRVQNRETLAAKLKEDGIPTAIHYPIPLYRQPPYLTMGIQVEDFPITEKLCQEVLSIPMSAFLTNTDQDKVIASLKKHVAVC